jgi:hypothetical protein
MGGLTLRADATVLDELDAASRARFILIIDSGYNAAALAHPVR